MTRVYHMVKAKSKNNLWLRMSLLLTQKWLPCFLFWPHDPLRLLFVRMMIFYYPVSFAFWEVTRWKWKWSRSVCPTLCDPVDCSPPGSSVHGIFQARVLEWIAISFSRGSSWPRDWTQVSCIVDRRFTVWATDESQVGIKITRRNIINLRYADDTTLMAESEEELKNLLMKVKEDL